MKKQTLISGAVTIAVGGFVAKVIGAIYRIPLTNLIGGEGIGLYQMAYPFYCLLLTVSATGIPSSIATLVANERAKGENARRVLPTAVALFLIIGGVGTALMIILAPFLAKAQGESGLTYGYIALAPSVFLVSAISVFRGWFQGLKDMRPTAVSEITEQVVKVGVGLVVAYLYRANLMKAVTGLLFAVSVSELVALIVTIIFYKRVPAMDLLGKDRSRVGVKEILSLSVFVTLSSALLPLSNLIESVLLVRLMDGYTEQAVTLYGLFSGGAVTVIGLPVSVCYGLAAASVPAVSEADRETAGRKVWKSLAITLLVALPSAVALYFFAPTLVGVVYRSLTGWEKEILVSLVKRLSISAVTLSLLQTASACLTARGKPKLSAVGLGVGVAVKIGLDFWLVANPEFSIFGAVIATNCCYAVALLLDLIFHIRISKRKKASE